MPLVFRYSLENILKKASEYMSLEDLELIRRAYEFTFESNKRFKFLRFSGESAIVHPLAVAEILVDWKLDAITIAAGILHDTIEDPEVHTVQLRATFKDEVLFLVDGVTKLKKFEIPIGTHEDTAYFYKIFLATAQDIRVALIKIADRLHNMRTLEYLPGYKRVKNALETMRIFVPLTSFLGMDSARQELEDISFQFGYPGEYEQTLDYIDNVLEEEDEFLLKVCERIRAELINLEIAPYARRFRHNIYWTYKLMSDKGPSFPQTGLVQVTVPTEADCYRALRAVHRCYQGLSGGFQDSIAFPSIDLKRMIETSVLHESGRPCVVRIVSSEMKRVNAMGVVTALAEPERLERADFIYDRIDEIKATIEDVRNEKAGAAEESLVNIITRDVLQKKIFVVTSDGRRVELPEGSTVLDFAYKISRSTGENFRKAKLNGRDAPLDAMPASCDQLRIITDDKARPRLSWLSNAKTPLARMYIKDYLSRQSPRRAAQAGRDALLRRAMATGLNSSGNIEDMENLLLPVVDFLQLPGLENFYQKVGYGEILTDDAIGAMKEQYKRSALLSGPELEHSIKNQPVFENSVAPGFFVFERALRGDIFLDEECTPVPGDDIVALAAGKKVTIHRSDCRQHQLQSRPFGLTRTVQAMWADTADAVFPVRIKVKLFSSKDAYKKVITRIEESGANILSSATSMKSPDGLELMEFLVEVTGKNNANDVCNSIMDEKDVVVAARI